MSSMKKPKSKIKDVEVLKAVGDEIIKAIEHADLISTPDGPIMATVKLNDGGFRKKNIESNWEFFPAYSYVGASENVIFGFQSNDTPDEWEAIEVDASKNLDQVFPFLANAVSEFMELGSIESMQHLINHLYSRKAVQATIDEEGAEERLRSLPTFGMF